jgi:hypothetical protein
MRHRFCVFVSVNVSQLEQFTDIVGEYGGGVFGKMAITEFRIRYPKVMMNERDSPALAVTNRNGRFTLIRGVNADSQYFRRLLKIAMAGRLDMSMRHLVKGALPMDVDGKRFVFCETLAGISIIVTVAVLWRRV